MAPVRRAAFVDCTPELRRVIATTGLTIPDGLEVHDGDPDEDVLREISAQAEFLLVEHTRLPGSIIRSAKRLRGIVFMGTGAATYVDLDAARERGVPVATIGGYGDQAVAEHAVALMFAGARRVAEMDRDIRRGLWRPVGGLQLRGRKIAVIGLGGIGSAFARMASGLGMSVSAWSRSGRNFPGFEADLDAALMGADVVSLHLGLNGETRGLIDARRLCLPRPGYVLVNTARAGLVDEAAMLTLLADGTIGHAALDVFPEEPIPPGHPIRSLANVTVTAHAAYMTDDAYATLWMEALHKLEQMRSASDAPSAASGLAR